MICVVWKARSLEGGVTNDYCSMFQVLLPSLHEAYSRCCYRWLVAVMPSNA